MRDARWGQRVERHRIGRSSATRVAAESAGGFFVPGLLVEDRAAVGARLPSSHGLASDGGRVVERVATSMDLLVQ